MSRALHLANAGNGSVSPNPLVGAVVVHENKIIGEGYHHHAGGPHAEVMAIRAVKEQSLLPKSTIYVTLEPCSHYGKTPPCASLIIEKKIPKVIVSCRDPFEKVAGKGIALLQDNGVEVVEDVLRSEGEWLNRRFFTFVRQKRPYIILKWAQSRDGFMDAIRKNNEKGVVWITQPFTKMLTHKWRAEEDSILVGNNTVCVDNPSLTTRAYFGSSPIRLVLDRYNNTPKKAQLLNDGRPTLIYSYSLVGVSNDDCYQAVTKEKDFLEQVLHDLYRRNIQSVIVEGGAKTLTGFIKQGLWDEARVLTGNNSLYAGLEAPKIVGKIKKEFYFGEDLVQILLPH